MQSFNEDCHQEIIEKILESYVNTKKFKLKSFNICPAGDGLLGFMANHSKVHVQYEAEGIEKEINLFIKSYPCDNPNRASINEKHMTFEREIIVYSKILHKFIKCNEKEKWYPDYITTIEKTLVFEDISLKGFKMPNLRNWLNKQHCLSALSSLAKFHSCSIIMEEQVSKKRKNTYRLKDDFEQILTPCFFTWNKWFINGIQSILEVAELSEKFGITTPHYEKVKNKWNDVFKLVVQICSYSDTMRNVLVHNDLWFNNMMFKYNEEETPIQCIFVDFQGCSLMPPMIDLNSFLYMNLEKELRIENMEYFQKYYYEEMASVLKKNRIDIYDIYPWNLFIEGCEMFKIWGLVHCLILYQFIFLSEEDAFKLMHDSSLFEKYSYESRNNVIRKTMEKDPYFHDIYMSRIDELISEYIIK